MLWNAVIPSVSGFVGGVATYLVVPWALWDIEQQRSDRNYKESHIKEWRPGFDSFDYVNESIGGTIIYSAVRPCLDAKVRKTVEHDRPIVIPGGPGKYPIKQRLLDEVGRIERA
jgi:hypothetical protein